MGDPESRDRETIRAEGSGPEATGADLGIKGLPEKLGATHTGELDPGQATEGLILVCNSSVTGVEAGDATHAGQADTPATHRPGPTIAGYQIEAELGRGGMGVVYRARQVRLNRPCALKMILAGAHATPEAAARFLAEAEAIARLQHPQIVQIHHIGEADGLPFFELEFVPGGSLDRKLNGTPWPPRQAAHLAEPLARGIAAAHALGIVHRDLKPANVLLADDATPKITDFGLAKALGSESGLTRSEAILGSPSYMAPEQAGGQAKTAGPAADIYAVGAILYELLTGRPPFRGATVLETLEQVKTAEPVPPSRLVPGLPRDAETIALKCLQKDPAKRYASAEALAEDLRRFLADVPIRARRVSAAERLLRWGRRNKLVAGLLASLVVTLVAGFVVSTTQWIRAEKNAEQLAQELYTEAELREDLARELYTSDVIAIQQAWDAGAIGRMGELLDRHRPLPGRPDWRGFEWHVFWRRLQGERPSRTLLMNGAVWDLAATPGGRTVAAWILDHETGLAQVTVWDAATGWVPRTFRGSRGGREGTFILSLALSPDGQVFATRSRFDREGREGSFINLWDAATGEVRQSLKNPEDATANALGLAFSHDGKMLVSGHLNRTIRLWDLVTGQARTIGESDGSTYNMKDVAISNDGTRIASVSSDKRVRLWDVQAGRVMHTFPRFGEGIAMSVAFSPDGRYLAAGSWNGAALWDLTTWEARELRGQSEAAARSVAFSPDGSILATSSTNTIKLWRVETGEPWATVKGHSNLVFEVAFLERGRTLASASLDETVKLWDLTRVGEEPEILTRNAGRSFGGLAFSTDGRSLASVSGDTVRSWDVDTGREHPPLEAPAGVPPGIMGIAISPDGRTLAAACHETDQAILWDLETRQIRRRIPHEAVASVAFSPREAILGTGSLGSADTLRLWDTDTGRPLPTFRGRPVQENCYLAFSPDGRIVASGGTGGVVNLWDVISGRKLAALPGHTANVPTVTFSRDGRSLASGSWDGTVRIWDVERRAELLTLKGHAALIWSAAFAPDGTTLASAGADGTIKLWDPATGRERCTLLGHDHPVYAVAFSPDGRILASRDGGGTIRLWRR
jgi:WD40 repeat protein/tRNA A-37 threonylcarbamoyl transferase component Bud32